ncbi:MAG: restriction endonuclease subunit S [Anaerolineales bacterium]|nr:MAG: restriction endonuclease subunit S [Anaerolineales bacterium]
MSEVTLRIEAEVTRKLNEVKKLYTPFRKGDILIAKITPSFENGKLAIANIRHELGFGTTEFHVVRPATSALDTKYLFHFLKQDAIRAVGAKRMTGSAGQKRLPASFVADLQIPLPSLAEQHRIAAIFDKVHELRALRRRALARLYDLAQSVFLEMFGDLAANNGWREVSIGEICDVKGGKRLPKGYSYSPEPTPYKYLRVLDFKTGVVNPNSLLYLYPETQAEISKYVVSEEDVVISIAGTIGATLPIGRSLHGVNLTENAAKLTPKRPNTYTANFLSFALQSPYMKSQITSQTGQVTIGKLALFRIEKIKFALPPIDLQKKFDDIYKATMELRVKHQLSISQLNDLASSLNQQFFC